MQLAPTAAQRDLVGGGSVKGSSEFGSRFSDLTDKVESVAASQLPIIDHLERMTTRLDRLGALSKFQAEEVLKEVLGDRVYSSLCGDARTALLDAERRFRDQETLDWNSVVANLGKAFELQLKYCLLPTLAQYLKQRGILCLPPQGETLRNGTPKARIIENGEVIPLLTFGLIAVAFSSESAPLLDFGRDYGVNLAVLRRWVFEVKEPRNRGAHETRMSFAETSAFREKWLGLQTRDGGAFGALCLR